MKNILTILLIIISLSAIAYYATTGGNTTVLPNGSTSRNLSWRTVGTDSLREHWANDGLGYNRYFSATELSEIIATRNLRLPTGLTPTFGANPDRTGYIFVQDSLGQRRLYYYVKGFGWQGLANNVIGLMDSLSKKINRDFSNLANTSIPYAKLVPLANLSVDASLTGTAYNGSTARTFTLNTANLNTWSPTPDAMVFNPAAASETGVRYQQAGVNKARVYLTASGNLVFGYYVGGILTTGYSLNTTSGINTFIQSPVVPTPTANDNSTKAASTAYVDNAVSSAVLQIVEIFGTSQAALPGRLYIPHNAALTTITLPSTAAIGSLIQVAGEGAGKWQVQHGNASDIIVGISGFTTTAGTTHGIIASDQNGTVSFRKTNTNKWTFTTLNGTVSAY